MDFEPPRIMKIASLSFKIISWLMFLSGIGGIMVNVFMKAVIAGNPLQEINTSAMFIDDKVVLLLVLTAIGVYMASESFLKMKIWAKLFLEFFSWVCLIFLIVAGFFLSGVLTPGTSGDLEMGFKTIWISGISSLTIPFILLIFSLRSPRVKECFKSENAGANHGAGDG